MNTIANPRARHYLTATGRQWRGAEYIRWIHQQWREFAAEHGITMDAARYRHQEFDAWLDRRYATDPATTTSVAEGADPSG